MYTVEEECNNHDCSEGQTFLSHNFKSLKLLSKHAVMVMLQTPETGISVGIQAIV